MVQEYPQIGRRDFLRQLGIGTLSVVAASCMPDLSYVQAQTETLNDFRCTFYVNIFAKGWVEGNSEMVAKLPENVRKRLVFEGNKDLVEFMTLDFEPKDLLSFDIYRTSDLRKPIVENVRKDNYTNVFLVRQIGSFNYTFLVTHPELEEALPEGKILDKKRIKPVIKPKPEQTMEFMDNQAIFNSALKDRTNPTFDTHSMLSSIGTLFNGAYPRAFNLKFDGQDVEYNVYGLEALAGKDVGPKVFGYFFQKRKIFDNDLQRFLDYQEKLRNNPLKISPEVEYK